jgi:short-subunit dehydrogenase
MNMHTRPLALVTGASSGIGAAFAERLAREGYDLILVARSRERLESLAGPLVAGGAAVEILDADLCDAAGLARVEQRVRALPALDLLVNNAGFCTMGGFAALDPEREEAEIRLNVLAPVRLSRAALPAMVGRGQGKIVNVSSLGGMVPNPWCATYGATKAFLSSFTEALAEELRGTGVQVQALCPGLTRTEFQERAGVRRDALPGDAMWMCPDAVVDASLAALGRGAVVCVPGWKNRLMAAILRLAPRALMTRQMGRSLALAR